MPIYEYRCQVCGHEFEEMLLGKEPEPEVCPECGEAPVVRSMSAPAFQLKGSGWYVTDYGKGNDSSTASPAESKASDDASSESDSNDSSSESKSESSKGESEPASSGEAETSSKVETPSKDSSVA